MSLEEVKQLASDTIDDFKQNEDIDEIMHRSIEKLNISDEDQHFSFKLESADLNHDLFLDLQRFDPQNRKKGTWFTEEYWNDLKMLLLKYPNNHQIIRRSLKLSKSSFCRLRQEFKNDSYRGSAINKKLRSKMELTKQEKEYIKAIVTPPTVPVTVDGI